MTSSPRPGADPAAAFPPATAAYLTAYQMAPSLYPGLPEAVSLADAARRMQVHDRPFPHGVIDNFLPEAVYKAAIAAWPSPDELSPVTLPGAAYVGSRTAMAVDERRASSAPTDPPPAWAGISSMLREPEFIAELFTRFADTINDSLTALDPPSGEPGFRLYLCQDRGTQEALGAHLDSMHKLLTVVIYIQLDGTVTSESQNLWGTTLYSIKPRAAGPIGFAPNASHSPYSRVQFSPNRAFVMPNSRRALHGVAGGQADVTRRSLMCGYWAFQDPR